ncbi:hypothetical protein [Romboutsia timonensis]|uniref:hypothetical protein n=1 Tax=Romboutsia timonensis TaxID=1776391 RepID=UPI0023F6B9AD|nr:hypothetical protein [Romboutsia timonensis]
MINSSKLCDEIYNFKRARDELIKPIEEEYQKYIDDVIFQELPFQYGDILKSKINGRIKYFVYEGINEELIVLYGCDENGVKNQHKIVCHWSTYDTFEIHKEVK